MKVLAVVPLYPPHHLGGYEVVCRGAMERFAEHGHEVLVLTSETRFSDRSDGHDSDSTVSVERSLKGWWDWRLHGPLHPTLTQRVAIERHNQRVVRDILERFRPDVVSIWSLVYLSFSVVTCAERQGVPVVASFGDDWICYAALFDAWTRVFDRRPWLRGLGRLTGLETRLPTFAHATVSAASRMIRDSIASYSRWKFPGMPIIPMGIETRELPLTEPNTEMWNWRIAFLGRVVPNKGIATLIRAMALLPDEARLVVDGYGAPEIIEEMRGLASDLGISDRIAFVRSPRAELGRQYQDADVVVFPSEWPEPYGLVALEAMACGTPVVATGTGGSGEFLVDGENCLVFPPGDAAALAKTVLRLAQDSGLRRHVAEGGAQTAQELTMDRYAERLETLHAQAAGHG